MKKFLFYLLIFIFSYMNNYSLIHKLNEYQYNLSSISSVVISPDNKYIIAGGLDGKIIILNLKNCNLIEILNNISAVESLDISNDNKLLLSGDRDNGVRLWNMKNFELLKFFDLPFKQIFTLNFSSDNKIFIVGGASGYEIINLQNFNSIKKEKVKNYAVRDACFSDNKKYLAIAIGNKIKIFKLEKQFFMKKIFKDKIYDLKFIFELEFQDLIYSIDISKNSQYMAVAGNSTYVTLIRMEDLAHLWSIKPHNLPIWDVKFSPDNKVLITAGKDKILNFIEIKTGKVIYTDKTHPDEIYSLAVSSDANYLVTGCRDGKIRIFKLLFNNNNLYTILLISFLSFIILLVLILIMQKIKRKKSVKDWEI